MNESLILVGKSKEGIKEVDNFAMARAAYVKNEQFGNADPFNQAALLQHMMSAKGWDHNDLREHLGDNNSSIDTYLGLLVLEQTE